MSERAIRLRVSGRVQGVGFRWFVKSTARRLGLAGWVRNLEDGSVELAARGGERALSDLRVAVRRGPDGARVESVAELAAPEPASLPHPFEIER